MTQPIKYPERTGWELKADLCRMIESLVGSHKYGRKLWNMNNKDLEEIYDKELEAYYHGQVSQEAGVR